MNFFAELKRRNVFRAAAFYAAAAWLLVQVATQVFPLFHVAEWILRAIVVAAVIGFPFATLLAWFYEWTPQGFQRESEIAPDESVTRRTGRKLDRWIIAMLSLAVVLLLTDKLVLRKDAKTVVSAPDSKSIAVLPFLNESGDPKDEYFADGLSEELISALAQIGDLKVIGRSSSFRFKGTNEETRTIGEKLGVSTLLEGTVRKQADRVRIVAELVNAGDGSEVWSQTFDRALKDVFAVQSEIASAVASSLKLTLLGHEKTGTNIASTNAEAHNAYLQGYFYFQRRNSDNLRKAISYFDDAIRLDPNYALAYAKSAEAWTWIADQSGVPHHEGWTIARKDAEKAVAIDPNLAEAHAALGWVLAFGEWKFQEGVSQARRAVELAPGSATATGVLSAVILYLGKTGEAEKWGRRAVEIDPLDYSARNNLARVLYVEGKLDEAIAQGKKSAELQPAADSSHRWQALAAVLRGDTQLALREAALEPGEGYRLSCLAIARFAAGDRPGSDAALAELIAQDQSYATYQVAQVYAWRGDKEKAFAWLQTALDRHDTGLLSLLKDPLLRNLRDDPRYSELVAKVGLPKSV